METLQVPHYWPHYNDVIMGAIASQITSLTIVYSTVYSDADQRKHQSSASLAFVRGIHRGPVNSPHKGPVTRKIFPFDDENVSIWWRHHALWGIPLVPHKLWSFDVSFNISLNKMLNKQSRYRWIEMSWRHRYATQWRHHAMHCILTSVAGIASPRAGTCTLLRDCVADTTVQTSWATRSGLRCLGWNKKNEIF